jgi:molybdopterin-binding protein
MNVQNVSSLPEYIDNFIQFNKNKLIEIYNEGLNVYNSGLLYFQCDKDNNTVDVFFLEPEKIMEMISQESWEQLKIDAGEQKIFLVKESDRMFIVKI